MTTSDRTLTDRKAEQVGSVGNRRVKVDSLPYALPDFLEPRSWIATVNNATSETKLLGGIAIISNVVPGAKCTSAIELHCA